MSMENGGLSVADALALGRDGDGGMFGGDGGIAVLFLFFLLAWGGGGFGFGGNNAGASGALTRAEMQSGFDAQTAQLQNMGITNGLYNGFYGMNTTLLNGFNGIGNEIAQNRFASQQCCCETNRNIDAVRYENERNTCNIIEAGNANTQRIVDVLTNNEIQNLRDKLQTAQLQIGEQLQTQNIINAVRPFPVPSYNTCSPYTASNNGCCGGNVVFGY